MANTKIFCKRSCFCGKVPETLLLRKLLQNFLQDVNMFHKSGGYGTVNGNKEREREGER